jgi:hypothetical protein
MKDAGYFQRIEDAADRDPYRNLEMTVRRAPGIISRYASGCAAIKVECVGHKLADLVAKPRALGVVTGASFAELIDRSLESGTSTHRRAHCSLPTDTSTARCGRSFVRCPTGGRADRDGTSR